MKTDDRFAATDADADDDDNGDDVGFMAPFASSVRARGGAGPVRSSASLACDGVPPSLQLKAKVLPLDLADEMILGYFRSVYKFGRCEIFALRFDLNIFCFLF